jgi:hypothetical protein
LTSIGITNLKTRDFANGITAAQPKIRHINDALSVPYIIFLFYTDTYMFFLILFLNINVSYTNAFMENITPAMSDTRGKSAVV